MKNCLLLVILLKALYFKIIINDKSKKLATLTQILDSIKVS